MPTKIEAGSIPIPGCWGCPRCGFQLTKCVLRVPDGGVFVNDEPKREVCPNDGVTLEQVYETPDDRLMEMGLCCYDVECLRCAGEGNRPVGWRYRDEPEGTLRPFSDPGERK